MSDQELAQHKLKCYELALEACKQNAFEHTTQQLIFAEAKKIYNWTQNIQSEA